jgi:hypothetical protein
MTYRCVGALFTQVRRRGILGMSPIFFYQNCEIHREFIGNSSPPFSLQSVIREASVLSTEFLQSNGGEVIAL